MVLLFLNVSSWILSAALSSTTNSIEHQVSGFPLFREVYYYRKLLLTIHKSPVLLQQPLLYFLFMFCRTFATYGLSDKRDQSGDSASGVVNIWFLWGLHEAGAHPVRTFILLLPSEGNYKKFSFQEKNSGYP